MLAISQAREKSPLSCGDLPIPIGCAFVESAFDRRGRGGSPGSVARAAAAHLRAGRCNAGCARTLVPADLLARRGPPIGGPLFSRVLQIADGCHAQAHAGALVGMRYSWYAGGGYAVLVCRCGYALVMCGQRLCAFDMQAAAMPALAPPRCSAAPAGSPCGRPVEHLPKRGPKQLAPAGLKQVLALIRFGRCSTGSSKAWRHKRRHDRFGLGKRVCMRASPISPPPRRGRVRVGVVRLNCCMHVIERTTPIPAFHLRGGRSDGACSHGACAYSVRRGGRGRCGAASRIHATNVAVCRAA